MSLERPRIAAKEQSGIPLVAQGKQWGLGISDDFCQVNILEARPCGLTSTVVPVDFHQGILMYHLATYKEWRVPYGDVLAYGFGVWDDKSKYHQRATSYLHQLKSTLIQESSVLNSDFIIDPQAKYVALRTLSKLPLSLGEFSLDPVLQTLTIADTYQLSLDEIDTIILYKLFRLADYFVSEQYLSQTLGLDIAATQNNVAELNRKIPNLTIERIYDKVLGRGYILYNDNLAY